MSVQAGGVAIYEEALNLKQFRHDVVSYPVPFDKITIAICPEANCASWWRTGLCGGGREASQLRSPGR